MRGARNRGFEADATDEMAGPSCDYPLPYCTVHANHNESNTARIHSTPVSSRIQTLNAANLRLSNAHPLPNPNRYSQPPPYPAACIDSPPAYTPYPVLEDFSYREYRREPRFIRPNQAAVQRRPRHRRSGWRYENFSRNFWRKKKVMWTAIMMFLVVPVALIFIIMAGVGVF